MARTVLIADESITIRSVAESLLRGESFSVHSAADGNMALEVAHAERPQLALIGEKLAGLGGAEVCKALKADAELGSMPIIFMRSERPGPAPDYADALLTKPFSPQSLLDAVHRFLASHAGKDSTSPVAISGTSDAGLDEELIDSALGLDDVGSHPAEERTIASGRSPIGLSREDHREQDMARPFGLVDENLNDAAHLEDLRVSKALDESFGLSSTPAPKSMPVEEASVGDDLEFEAINTREPDAEVDLALDAAFGEPSPSSAGITSRSSASIQDPGKSSLNEVSLGDTDLHGSPKERTLAPSAAPGGSIDLGGVDDVETDRPHDYDWFIKEMQQDPSAKEPSRAKFEPPRIEPLSPTPAASKNAHPAPQAPSKAPADKAEAGSDKAQPHHAYDDFISEFKAEIARIEGMAPSGSGARPAAPGATAPPSDKSTHSSSGKISFEAVGEKSKVEPPHPAYATIERSVRAWGDDLISSVTAQVARELAAKIDSKMIYSLIEEKLKEAQKNKT